MSEFLERQVAYQSKLDERRKEQWSAANIPWGSPITVTRGGVPLSTEELRPTAGDQMRAWLSKFNATCMPPHRTREERLLAMDESGCSAGADVADEAATETLAVWEQRQVAYVRRDAIEQRDAEAVRALCTREIDRLSERLAAVTADNERLRAERDALEGAIKALTPQPEPAAKDNPFARRHSGQAPDRGEPR